MLAPMKYLLATAAMLSLSACVTPEPSYGDRMEWRCDGGAAFSARLTDAGDAKVYAGGQEYTLPGVPAGSGTRYTDGTVEYWEHGDEAMLNGAQGGPYNNCRR